MKFRSGLSNNSGGSARMWSNGRKVLRRGKARKLGVKYPAVSLRRISDEAISD
jgi:hypothetical protein